MKFTVNTLRAAERDCNGILEHVAARSKSEAAEIQDEALCKGLIPYIPERPQPAKNDEDDEE